MTNGIGAFWSYARQLDPSPLEALYEALQTEIGHCIGRDFKIWRDRQDIATGTYWREEIRAGLHRARILIAIVSPRWLASRYCAEEYHLFLEAEKRTQRKQLIFPIYYMKDTSLESQTVTGDNPLLADLRSRQMSNWLHLREQLITRGIADDEVRTSVCKLANEISEAVRSQATVVPASSVDHQPNAHSQATKRTRRIRPQGTPKRPQGPARIELSAGGNCTLMPAAIDLKIGTEFTTTTVETQRYAFPLSVRRVMVQVDAYACDIDPESCFASATDGKNDNIIYRRLGEWEVRKQGGEPLEGDFFPGTPVCQLVNCEAEAGATARIIAETVDFCIDMGSLHKKGPGLLNFINPTKEKLIAIWLKERAGEALGGTALRVVLHESKLDTELTEPEFE
jgi:hypothetical protein